MFKLGLVAVMMQIGLFLVVPEIMPGVGSAEQGVAAETTLTLSSGGDLNSTARGGVFSSIDEVISVTTTNYTGYTLKLETAGATTDLVNTTNSSLVIPTITLGQGETSKTASAMNGTYGYSLNATNYLPVPAVSGAGDILKTTNAANTTADNTTLTFGVKPGNMVPAGTYRNTFLITAEANNAGYMITYDANAGADTVTGMPNPITQYGTVSGLTVYLDSAVPMRSGYDFMGWAEDAAATEADYTVGGEMEIDPETANTTTLYAVWKVGTCEAERICYIGNGDDGTGVMSAQTVASDSDATLIAPNFSKPGYAFAGWNMMADGSGTMYGPMETIHTGDLSVSGLKLYAIWRASEGILQNWMGCSAMSTGDVKALTDFRDGNTYLVAKLADGKCWTVENFRLNPRTALLSKANTNGPTTEFLDRAATSNSTTAMCASNTAACDDTVSYNANNIDRSLTPGWNADSSSTTWWSFGVYYNWYTASAGNGTYSQTSGNVSGDLCPAGWRLPTGGAGGEYAALNTAVNGGLTNADTGLRVYPVNFVYSGDYNATITTGRGRQGRIWSATASSAANAYRMGYAATVVTPINNYGKWDGFNIRCVVKNDNTALNGNIHYEANGADGAMADDVNVNLNTAAAKTATYAHAHFVFSRWNTAADGSGTNVKDRDMVAEAARNMNIGSGGTLTLYAIWGKTGTLSYDANGGTGAPGDSVVITEAATFDFTVSVAVPAKTDHVFLGWSEDPDAEIPDYVGGDTFSTAETEMTLYAVWRAADCAVGNICYRGNGADAGTSLTHVANSNTNTILRPSDFSRAGYGFLGWNTEEDGSGTTYGAMGTMKTGDLTSEGVSMWATWLAAAGTMQSFTGCGAMSIGDVTALTDTRDNNTYAVAKLADGKCWMIENLRLDISTATITAANTNSPTATFLTQAETATSTTAMCGNRTAACIDKIVFDTNNINRSLTANYAANNNASSLWSYGVWYNWYAASAGNGTYAQTSGNVAGDICPSGWRLPTGGPNSEFTALNAAVNGGATNTDLGLRTYPVNMVYAGDHNKSADSNRGTYARYWSSTAADADTAYRFGVKSNEVTPLKAYDKWDGFTVRCVAQ